MYLHTSSMGVRRACFFDRSTGQSHYPSAGFHRKIRHLYRASHSSSHSSRALGGKTGPWRGGCVHVSRLNHPQFPVKNALGQDPDRRPEWLSSLDESSSISNRERQSVIPLDHRTSEGIWVFDDYYSGVPMRCRQFGLSRPYTNPIVSEGEPRPVPSLTLRASMARVSPEGKPL